MNHTKKFGTEFKQETPRLKAHLKVFNGYEKKTSLCLFMEEQFWHILPTSDPAISQQVNARNRFDNK